MLPMMASTLHISLSTVVTACTVRGFLLRESVDKQKFSERPGNFSLILQMTDT